MTKHLLNLYNLTSESREVRSKTYAERATPDRLLEVWRQARSGRLRLHPHDAETLRHAMADAGMGLYTADVWRSDGPAFSVTSAPDMPMVWPDSRVARGDWVWE